MQKINVTAEDLPNLNKIQELNNLMQKLRHLVDHKHEKVVCQGRTWTYEDLVLLAYEYYGLAKNYGIDRKSFVKWLTEEKAILAKHNLVWPIK